MMLILSNYLWNKVRARAQDCSGQSMAEYAMILALVVVAILLTLTNLGGAVKKVFGDIITKFQGVTPS